MGVFSPLSILQKKRGVHKISARNSGAGNGCANFMGAWHFLVLSAGKPPHAHKIPPFRGGGFWVFLEGGWKCPFYFYGRGGFFRILEFFRERAEYCFESAVSEERTH